MQFEHGLESTITLLSNLESCIKPKKDISQKVKVQKTTLLETEKAIENEEKVKLPILRSLEEASKRLQAEKKMVSLIYFLVFVSCAL